MEIYHATLLLIILITKIIFYRLNLFKHYIKILKTINLIIYPLLIQSYILIYFDENLHKNNDCPFK